MFEAALAAIETNFPPGKLPGTETLGHTYIADSGNFGESGRDSAANTEGFDLAEANSSWGFTLDDKPTRHAPDQHVQ
jgi:Mn-containing catalase